MDSIGSALFGIGEGSLVWTVMLGMPRSGPELQRGWWRCHGSVPCLGVPVRKMARWHGPNLGPFWQPGGTVFTGFPQVRCLIQYQ